jgi:hypothetical protein
MFPCTAGPVMQNVIPDTGVYLDAVLYLTVDVRSQYAATGSAYLRGEPLCSRSLFDPPEFLRLKSSTIAFGDTNSTSYFSGVSGTATE